RETHELQERRLGTVTRPDGIELQRNIQALNGPQHHMRRKLLSAGRVEEAVLQRWSKAAALPKGAIGVRGKRCQSYGHADPQKDFIDLVVRRGTTPLAITPY